MLQKLQKNGHVYQFWVYIDDYADNGGGWQLEEVASSTPLTSLAVDQKMQAFVDSCGFDASGAYRVTDAYFVEVLEKYDVESINEELRSSRIHAMEWEQRQKELETMRKLVAKYPKELLELQELVRKYPDKIFD